MCILLKRSDKRVQEPKVQDTTKTLQYGKIMQHNEVVKDSTDSGFTKVTSYKIQ